MKHKYKQIKSEYWRDFPEQYTVDENGNIHIHEDADEEVKKSYKQYTYEQMMAGYFIEEEDDEEEVERTFSISEKTLQSLSDASQNKTFDIPELHLEKDISMYNWMSQRQYYTVVDGEYIFKEDTPQEILDAYKKYKKQLKRLDSLKQPKGNAIVDFVFDITGMKKIFKKKK